MKISTLLSQLKYQRIIILLGILSVGIFSVYTTSGSHNWGDDFALYISHAKNISEGKAYDDTGLILNEYAPTYSPQNYPPGFPLLLAPVYAIAGSDFYVLKLFIVAWFLLLLWLIWVYFKDKLSFPWLITIILLIGFSPFYRDQKESILADIPAACFILLAFLMDEKRRMHPGKFIYLLLLAFIIWFGAAIRITGILVLPAIIVFELFRDRRINRDIWYITFLVIFLLTIQGLLLPSGNYADILFSEFRNLKLHVITDNMFGRANNYIRSFSGTTHLGYITPLNTNLNELLFWMFNITAATGFYRKIMYSRSPAEFFVLFYMLVLFIFPGYQGTRYLIPIIPFYLYYSFTILQNLQLRWFSRSILILTCVSITFIYLDDHNRMPRYPISDGVQSPQSLETFQFIRENTDADAVLMATKPRAFCLFTDRKGIVFPNPKFKDKFYTLLEEHKVQYIITGKYDYFPFMQEEVINKPEVFSQIFANDMFQIYRIK